MIRGFRHTCIVVSDTKRPLRFYRDVVGLKVVKILVTYSNSKICFGYDPDNNLIEFIEDL